MLDEGAGVAEYVIGRELAVVGGLIAVHQSSAHGGRAWEHDDVSVAKVPQPLLLRQCLPLGRSPEFSSDLLLGTRAAGRQG